MVIIEKLKYITVCYYWSTHSVKLMIKEHYDIPEYKNTAFLLNTYNIADFKKEEIEFINTHSRIIYYMLEHSMKDSYYFENLYKLDIGDFATIYNSIHYNEWWTMDYEPLSNKIIRDNLDIPIKYKPVRYTSIIKPVEDIYTTKKTVDLCHIGTIWAEHRLDLIKKIEFPYHGMSLKFITQNFSTDNNILEMNSSRFILDTLRLDSIITQNQVRIFELLCMGYTVCSEKCEINIFPELIYEWNTIEDLQEIVEKDEYLYPAEKYKEMTYTDEAYEKYINYLIELQS